MVISGVIRPPVWIISIATLLMTLLITTHEPLSWCLSRGYFEGSSLQRQTVNESCSISA